LFEKLLLHVRELLAFEGVDQIDVLVEAQVGRVLPRMLVDVDDRVLVLGDYLAFFAGAGNGKCTQRFFDLARGVDGRVSVRGRAGSSAQMHNDQD
jgi:hypothetical protein